MIRLAVETPAGLVFFPSVRRDLLARSTLRFMTYRAQSRRIPDASLICISLPGQCACIRSTTFREPAPCGCRHRVTVPLSHRTPSLLAGSNVSGGQGSDIPARIEWQKIAHSSQLTDRFYSITALRLHILYLTAYSRTVRWYYEVARYITRSTYLTTSVRQLLLLANMHVQTPGLIWVL